MKNVVMGPMQMQVEIEQWPLASPFRIAGYTFESLDVVVVGLSSGGHTGRGEAAGVYYKNDTPALIAQHIEKLRPAIEKGISRDALQQLLAAGGARNALDCALWELQAKLHGSHVWQIAGIEQPRPVLTTFTCGADQPDKMVRAARAYDGARAIKLKLTGEPIDVERVQAVRDSLPEAWLAVDANQGFTRPFLERLMPVLTQARVALIEQPFPVGQEALLEGFGSPIPIAADESVQSCAEIAQLVGRFDMLNIKLDKCGGLTEGLAMVARAREHGLDCMVGNMMGTSLAMAPAFLLAQLCKVADLDGPAFLTADRPIPVHYANGSIMAPLTLWG